MKRITIGFACCFFALISFNAQAQKSDKKFSFGFGIEGGGVTGDFKDLYGAAAGLTIRGSYKVGPGFATLTTGGIACVPKELDLENEDIKAGILIPVKAGYKFIFRERFFAMGELGFSTLHVYFPDAEEEEIGKVKETGFTFAPTIGAQFGTFEIGLRYESTSFKNSVNLSMAMVRLGFNF